MKNNLLKKVLKSTAAKLIAAFLMSGAVQESQAVTFLWNNTGSNWTSPTSWTNGVQPSSTSSSTTTDEIQFGNFGANNNTVILTSIRAARNVTFLTNANAYQINSFNGTQTMSSSAGITNNSTATQTFNILVENANGNNTWFQTAGGGLVFNNIASLTTASSGTSRTLTLAGDGSFTFNNELKQGGTATLGKVIYTGNGNVTFNGTNTLGGGFDITGGGTVNVNGGTGLGAGVILLAGNSGTTNTPKLVINTTNGLSTANSLKGSSSTTTMGTLDLAGSNSVALTTYILNQYQGNSMNFTNHGGYKTLLEFTNVANTLTSSTGTSGGKRLINNSTNLTIQFDGTMDIGSTTADNNTMIGGAGDFLFKGSLLNTASALRGLNKTGTGTVTFEAINSYNGDTTVQEGKLLINTSGSILSSSAIVSGGTLQVKGVAGGVIVNSGSLLVDSGGTVGSTTVSGGTLLVSGTAGTTIVNSGTATVNLGGVIGSTTINGSLLSVNGNAGDVLVNSGGRLGGSGSVQGLTLNGGTVAPGNSPGLLTAYELNGSNGTFQFQLGAPTTRGTTYDAINVSTLLTLGASTSWTFETLDNYSFQMNDSYDLFNFESIEASTFDVNTLLAALPNLDTANSNLKWDANSFTTDGVVNVIPEPSTLSLLLGGASVLIGLRIVRRNKCKLPTRF
jgi:autotransporter-associated beta strand protein